MSRKQKYLWVGIVLLVITAILGFAALDCREWQWPLTVGTVVFGFGSTLLLRAFLKAGVDVKLGGGWTCLDMKVAEVIDGGEVFLISRCKGSSPFIMACPVCAFSLT